jgi:hypothetical protein
VLGPNPFGQREPIESARRLDVSEHQIDRLAGFDELHRSIGARSLDYLKAGVSQRRGNVYADEKLIFDEQDSDRSHIELLQGNHSHGGPPLLNRQWGTEPFVPGQLDWGNGSLHLRSQTTVIRPRESDTRRETLRRSIARSCCKFVKPDTRPSSERWHSLDLHSRHGAACDGVPRGVWDCYSVCTDSGPISLWASWSMHIEAMNFGGMGHAEDATMLGRVRCAFDAIASTNPATKWTGEASFIRVPGFD